MTAENFGKWYCCRLGDIYYLPGSFYQNVVAEFTTKPLNRNSTFFSTARAKQQQTIDLETRIKMIGAHFHGDTRLSF